MNETSKTKKIWTNKEISFLNGDGIDIGSGKDPVFSHVRAFDQDDGDANFISKYVDRQYDFVFSSHCLEHMHDPRNCLKEWYSIIKPGGYLFIIVPDEDLYEQGRFPSKYNPDHKWTFTINKRKSWSPKSLNLLELAQSLNGELICLELQDFNYDYALYNHGYNWWNHRVWRWFKKVSKPFRGTIIETFLSRIYRVLGSSFDQTWMGGDRLAQIQLIVKKPLDLFHN